MDHALTPAHAVSSNTNPIRRSQMATNARINEPIRLNQR